VHGLYGDTGFEFRAVGAAFSHGWEPLLRSGAPPLANDGAYPKKQTTLGPLGVCSPADCE